MMSEDIFFMPLGGGQRVGASCYYLRFGEMNLILDAGIGADSSIPNIGCLLTSRFMQSLSQINHIFISHAHMDHIGYLMELMRQTSQTSVYMTEMTKRLASYQLYDRNYINNTARNREHERLAIQRLFQRVTIVSYMENIKFNEYEVTFIPAGHIPGAMMMLFRYKNKRILYTGDYSLNETALTDGCMIPQNIEIDTLIMCGLHAKHPNYKKNDRVCRLIESIYNTVIRKRKTVLCKVPQLSKGIEFIKMLNNYNETAEHKIDIYIDTSISAIIEKMEQLYIPIFTQYNHPISDKVIKKPCVLVASSNSKISSPFFETIRVDFSLHEDFSDIEKFIKIINPKQAVIVHCASNTFDDYTIEQKLMKDGNCRTQFIFAEESEMYKL